MEIYTVGFAGKSAEVFFGLLKSNGIQQLVDIRLNNSSQLAGFTKADNLPFFLREICGAGYVHEIRLAPTEQLFTKLKKQKGSFTAFEKEYLRLLDERNIAQELPKAMFSPRSVLLCSEQEATHCHRRQAAEYLKKHWKDVTIVHL